MTVRLKRISVRTGMAVLLAVAVVASLLPSMDATVGADPFMSYVDVVLDDGPLAYFPLDDLVEPLGTNVSGNQIGQVTGLVESVGESGALAHDIGFSVSKPQEWRFEPGGYGDEQTVEFWLNLGEDPDSALEVVSPWLGVDAIISRFGVELRSGTAVSVFNATDVLGGRGWRHVAITRSNVSVELFLNGQSLTSVENLSGWLTPQLASHLEISGTSGGDGPWIDEVAVYDSVLTGPQIASRRLSAGLSQPVAVNLGTVTPGDGSVEVAWSETNMSGRDWREAVIGYEAMVLDGTVVKSRRFVGSESETSGGYSTVFHHLSPGTYEIQVVAVNSIGSSAVASQQVSIAGTAPSFVHSVSSLDPIVWWRFGDDTSTLSIASQVSGQSDLICGQGGVSVAGAILDDAAFSGASCLASLDFSQVQSFGGFMTRSSKFRVGDVSVERMGSLYKLGYFQGNELHADVQHGRAALTDQWSWIDVSLTGRALTLRENGDFVASLELPISVANNFWSGTLPVSLEGGVDELALFDAPLSQPEIDDLLGAAGRVGTAPSPMNVSATYKSHDELEVTWDSPTLHHPSEYLVEAWNGSNLVAREFVAATATELHLREASVATSVQVSALYESRPSSPVVSTISGTPNVTSYAYGNVIRADNPWAWSRFDSISKHGSVPDSAGNNAAIGLIVSNGTSEDISTVGRIDGGMGNSQHGTGLRLSQQGAETDQVTGLTASLGPLAYGNSTTEFWLRLPDPNSTLSLILHDAIATRSMQVTLTQTSVHVAPLGGSFSVDLSDGDWHHLAFSTAPNNHRLSIDGQAVLSSSLSPWANASLLPGPESVIALGSVHGRADIDELVIYPSALTNQQIKNHYEASGRFTPTSVSVEPGQVVGQGGQAGLIVELESAAYAGAPIAGRLEVITGNYPPIGSIEVTGAGSYAIPVIPATLGNQTVIVRFLPSTNHYLASISNPVSATLNTVLSGTSAVLLDGRPEAGGDFQVKVSVLAAGQPVGGDVVAKLGSTTLATKALSNGSAIFTSSDLGTVTTQTALFYFEYLGTAQVSGSSDEVTVEPFGSVTVDVVGAPTGDVVVGAESLWSVEVASELLGWPDPVGLVQAFVDGDPVAGSITQLDVSGAAEVPLTLSSLGSHDISFKFLSAPIDDDVVYQDTMSEIEPVAVVEASTEIDLDVAGVFVEDQAVTLTATVTSLDSPLIPSGSVTFSDGVRTTVVPVDPSGVAEWVTTFDAGSYQVSAEFSSGPNGLFRSSNTSESFLISPGTELSVVLSGPVAGVVGDKVSITAVVVDDSDEPVEDLDGDVVFVRAGMAEVRVPVGPDGAATAELMWSTANTFAVRARFESSSVTTELSTAHSVVVSKRVLNASAQWGSDTLVYGQSPRLNMSVGAVDGVPLPSGMVRVLDSSDTEVAAFPVGNGQWSRRVALPAAGLLGVGPHYFTVTIDSDSRWESWSQVISLEVVAGGVVVTNQASVQFLTSDDQLRVPYSVQPMAPSTGTPDGDVELWVNGQPVALCRQDVVTGEFIVDVDLLPVVPASTPYEVSVKYLGTAEFEPTFSAPTAFFVGNTTSVAASVSSPSGSSALGAPVSVDVNVSSSTLGVPSGQVVLYDGDRPVDAVMLDNLGQATLTTARLFAGVRDLTVRYVGNHLVTPVFGPSTSPVFTHTVNSGSGVTLSISTSTTRPVLIGQSFYVNLQAVGSGSPTVHPTGEVELFINDVVVGSVTIPSSGVGTFRIPNGLSAGSHVIRGEFVSSSPNYLGMTATGSLTVSPVAPLTLSSSMSSHQGVAPFETSLTLDSVSEPDAVVTWRFGDGSVEKTDGHPDVTIEDDLAGSTATHTYMQPGIYRSIIAVEHGEQIQYESHVVRVAAAGPLVPSFGGDRQGVVDRPVIFDAGSSLPEYGITTYHWDFDDTTTASGQRVNHSWSTPGPKTVTLTISNGVDVESVSATVLIQPLATAGSAAVVVKSGGVAVAGASVFVNDHEDGYLTEFTNNYGVASFDTLPEGIYTGHVVANGFLPKPFQFEVTALGSVTEVEIVPGDVGGVEVEHRELNKGEKIALGIDPYDPDNQVVYAFEIVLPYGTTQVPIRGNGSYVGRSCTSSCTITSSGDGSGSEIYMTVDPSTKMAAVIVIPAMAGYLKQFFEVSMTVINYSNDTYDFEDGTAKLLLPPALSLAPTSTPQPEEQAMTIPAGQSRTASWVVRGDFPGEHHVGGVFTGSLAPLGIPLQIVGYAENPIIVHGPEALDLKVEADSEALLLDLLRVKLTLTNTADIALDNASFTVNPTIAAGILQPRQQLSWQTEALHPGESINAKLNLYPIGWGPLDLDGAFVRRIGGFELDSYSIESMEREETLKLASTQTVQHLKVQLEWQDDGFGLDYVVYGSNEHGYFEPEPIPLTSIKTVQEPYEPLMVVAEFEEVPGTRIYAVGLPVGDRAVVRHNAVVQDVTGKGTTVVLDHQVECKSNAVTTINFANEFHDVSHYRYRIHPEAEWTVVALGSPKKSGLIKISGLLFEIAEIEFQGTEHKDPVTGEYLWSETFEVRGCNHERWRDKRASVDSLALDGDPVNTLTGALFIPGHDVVSPVGVTGLDFRRTYDSGGSTSDPAWGFSFTENLVIASNGDVTLQSSNTREVVFAAQSTGGFVQPHEEPGVLTETHNGYLLEYPDGSALTFDDAGLLLAHSHPDGQVVTIARNGAGQVTKATSSAAFDGSMHLSFAYTGDNLTSVTTFDGRVFSYGYNSEGNLVSVTAPGDHTWTYTYDGISRVVSEVNPAGIANFVATYDNSGRVIQQQLSTGEVTAYTYEVRNRTGALAGEDHTTIAADTRTGATRQYHYNLSDQLIGETNPLGSTITYGYDNGGRLVETIDATGVSERTEYVTLVPSGRIVLSKTESAGLSTTYSYDSVGRVVAATLTGTDNQSTLTQTTGYTGQGWTPTSMTDPAGATSLFSLGSHGRVETVTNADGDTAGFSYDMYGRVIAATDGENNESVLSYDTAGRLLTQATPAGRVSSVVYNTAGQITHTVDGNGHVTTLSYDSAGRLASEMNPEGETTSYSYHPESGLLWKVVDPLTRVTEFVYDHRGNVVKIVHPDLSESAFGYDLVGQLVWERDETGAETSYEYDAAGRVTRVIDPAGVSTTTEFDSFGRPVRVEHDSGRFEAYLYDVFGRVVGVETPEGTAATTYGVNGRVESTTDVRGVVTTYTYSPAGRLLAATENGNRTTSYSYDAAGRVVSVLEPGRLFPTEFTYDADGLLTVERTPEGRETSFEYDDAGRLTETVDPAGVVHATTYDDAGRVITTQSGVDGEIAFSYDAAGQLVTVVDALGAETEFTYDLRGRVVREEDALGGEWDTAYDLAGRLTQSIDPLDRVATLAYDAAGRLTSQIDPAGRIFTQSFDAAGRVVSWQATQQGNTMLSGLIEYEPVTSQVLSETVNDEVTSYSYDEFGALTSRVSPDGRVLEFGYDELGRRTKVRGVDGYERNYTYDRADRVVAVSSPHMLADTFTDIDGAKIDPSKWTTASRGGATASIQNNQATFTLAASSSSSADLIYKGEVNGAWELNFTVDLTDFATNANFYTYGRYVDGNNYDRVEIRGNGDIAILRRRGLGLEQTLGTTSVDADVVRVSLVVEATQLKLKVWDVTEEEPSGWDISASDWLPYLWGTPRWFIQGNNSGSGSVTIDDVEVIGSTRTLGTYTYNNDDQVLTETFGATGRTYSYDDAGRLNSFDQTGSGIARSSALTYDDSGRVKKEVTNSVTRNFMYDLAGQVTATTGVEGPRAYTYDQLGRRVSETIGTQSATFTYNAASELLARTVTAGGGQSTVYSYDLSGRRVSETLGSSVKLLAYDALGRLDQTVESGTTRAFNYNAGGLVERVESTGVKQGASWIDWDDADGLVGINTPEVGYSTYTGNNGVWGVRSVGSNVVGVGIDWMGNALASGPGGTQATNSIYDVYGRQAGSPGTSIGSTGVSVGYRGEVAVDNHVLLRARVYDPNTGQFISKDPVAGRLGYTTLTNPYHYADNDPIGRYDPTGMTSESLIDRTLNGIGSVLGKLGSYFSTGVEVLGETFKSVQAWFGHYSQEIAFVAAIVATLSCLGSMLLLCIPLGIATYFGTKASIESCAEASIGDCTLQIAQAAFISAFTYGVGGAVLRTSTRVDKPSFKPTTLPKRVDASPSFRHNVWNPPVRTYHSELPPFQPVRTPGTAIELHPFSGGATHITTTASLDNWSHMPAYGGPNGMFVAPTKEIDDLLATGATRHDIRVALGLDEKALQAGELVRIDIPDPFDRGLRLPDPRLGNVHNRPGTGLTTGNIHEAVIDSVSKSDPTIIPKIIEGR